MPVEQLVTTNQAEDVKVNEYLKIKDILAGVGREFGFQLSEQTNQAWAAIARSTRYLDQILDEGSYADPYTTFEGCVNYILALGDELPDNLGNAAADTELNDAREVLGGLGYGERLAVKDTADHIGRVDARIKQATTPKDLERWRNLEGVLTADIFLNAVPFGEKYECPRFDEFAEYARRFFAFGNNMDSLADFQQDSGTTHQVEATLKNRAIFATRSLGSLAAVMKLRGPLHNPVAAGRAIMAESSN